MKVTICPTRFAYGYITASQNLKLWQRVSTKAYTANKMAEFQAREEALNRMIDTTP
jgi:hypothetical protein